MKSKTPQSYRKKGEAKQRSTTKEYRETKSTERRVYHSTPPENHKNYLTDETWDILPKTDYTYAKSGSYSPRFFGRKYISPNMSRYRLRVKGPGLEDEEAEFSDEGEDLIHIHDYNEEYYGNKFEDDYEDDRNSNMSYETGVYGAIFSNQAYLNTAYYFLSISSRTRFTDQSAKSTD